MPKMYEWMRVWNTIEREKNVRKLYMNQLLDKVDEALCSYGRDVVSVDYNEITGMIDINICTDRFSDVIFAGVVPYKNVNRTLLIQALDEFGVGYCLG